MVGLPERAVGVCTTLAAVLLLSGCSSPGKTSAPATGDPDGGVDVTKMDTGPYAIAPTHPFGTAGSDRRAQSLLEAQRLAEVTVGPWEVNDKLLLWGQALNAAFTGPMPDAATLRSLDVLPAPLPDIAERNGLMTGFSSLRLAPAGGTPPRFWGMHTMVLRFPDPAAASAAAQQMATAYPGPPGAGPRLDVTLPVDPGTIAAHYDLQNGTTAAIAITPHDSLVLFDYAEVYPGTFGLSAPSLALTALRDQQTKLKTFVPTPADKLPDLPLDPSGFLLSRTLLGPTGVAPTMIGVWRPDAWLHFEDDPPRAATWLRDAGVDWVSQRLATVYRTKNADAAEQLLTKVVDDGLRRTPSAKPAGEVPGLPRARCFERESADDLEEAAQSWQRIDWHVKCAAATDRYVFTVYAASQQDAAQRISAQWRILAGK